MGDQWERGPKRRGFESGHSVGDYSPRPAIVHAGGDDDGRLLEGHRQVVQECQGIGFVVLGDGSGEAFLHIEVLERAGYANITFPHQAACSGRSGSKGSAGDGND